MVSFLRFWLSRLSLVLISPCRGLLAMASDGGSHGGPANGSSVTTLVRWLRTRSQTEKAALLGAAALLTLIVLWYFVEDHDNLFIIAETVHFIGIGVLVYKLTQEKSCSGLSLKSQILTAIFLAIRLMCSFVMEYVRVCRAPVFFLLAGWLAVVVVHDCCFSWRWTWFLVHTLRWVFFRLGIVLTNELRTHKQL